MDYGIIVDLETTGINPEKDEIIEVGIVSFKVEENKTPTVVEIYGALSEPTIQIPPEIIKITGIDNAHVKGERVDWNKVKLLFNKASIAIAHNAVFDVGFLSKKKELSNCDIHWACSMRHIEWKRHGFSTRALNYLAADHGFVNPFAHRAVFDCALTLRLITPYFEELVKNSYENEYEIVANKAPYSSKDDLKLNGYFWDSSERVWKKNTYESSLDEERDFLSKTVYKNQPCHQENRLNRISLMK